MQQDRQDVVLISSNKELTPGLLSGQGHGHDRSQPSSGKSPQAAAAPGQDKLATSQDLGKPGLLGEDIIPLSVPAAPHSEHPHQPHGLAASIKAAFFSAPSHTPASGDIVDQPTTTMIFSDLYKSPRSTFNKLRNPFPHGVPPPPDIEADLVSRDKAKQKEAVKKYLAEKIRNDWEFTWPPVGASTPVPAGPTTPAQAEPIPASGGRVAETTPALATANEDAVRDPGEEADAESDAESVYSTISEDPEHFRPRADWTSDLSDDDDFHVPASPFRFDSPEAVGAAVCDSIEMKRARRRRAVRDEAKWNPGLACFEARRNAWTGAKTVRVKPKPRCPVSPSSPRRLFWRHHRTQSTASHGGVVSPKTPAGPTSPLQPTETRTSTATATESDSGKSGTCVQRTSSRDSTSSALYPVQTVLPIPAPLLPPQNPMRASIQPSMYGSLYDKVVVQSLQPSCPINLADMLRACVVGWKRDGEWPPKSSYPAPAVQTPSADVIAARQRKAEQQRRKSSAANANPSTPGNGSGSRRLSFVGFFHGSSNKPTAPQEEKEKDNALGHSQSHSDEGAGSGKFRRSLQKVFSLGQHGHAHSGPSANGNANAGAPLSPTSPTTKEVTAAG
ncbi:uncharacterized protein THITE_2123539 [Thermothielavioides terrestris NRRL 8126]|uniref:Gag1-like clamp domain-containing protein n=1 Tax=Thermothielavioides terrestris (strain ATCC 38088 / NRRL 8126) TaxID=578455 RepID=G2RHL3_THETT|nr:uncharacterized protein THITE_2123539 [Thermothielavioides terrestris NRRL 8126]AEO71325.1 hypothetical protein THITE_2123539 [Thermothielavioides terrestris NRRL 8126]